MRRLICGVFLAAMVSTAGCANNEEVDAGVAFPDTGPRPDSGTVSSVDSGPPDAGSVGTDSGPTGTDSGPSGTDSGTGLPIDSGGIGLPIDSGGIGIPGGCTGNSDCDPGEQCCMFGGFGTCLSDSIPCSF